MLFVQGEALYLGINLNIKETMLDSLEMLWDRLAKELFPYASVAARVRS